MTCQNFETVTPALLEPEILVSHIQMKYVDWLTALTSQQNTYANNLDRVTITFLPITKKESLRCSSSRWWVLRTSTTDRMHHREEEASHHHYTTYSVISSSFHLSKQKRSRTRTLEYHTTTRKRPMREEPADGNERLL